MKTSIKCSILSLSSAFILACDPPDSNDTGSDHDPETTQTGGVVNTMGDPTTQGVPTDGDELPDTDSDSTTSGGPNNTQTPNDTTDTPDDTTDTPDDTTDDDTGLGPELEFDRRAMLGTGYDFVGATTKNLCLDLRKRGFEINQENATEPSTFSVDLVRNNEHLSELLALSGSLALGFQVKKFGLGVSASQSHFSKTVTDEHHVRFVVRMENRRETLRLSAPVDALAQDYIDVVLKPNDDNAKRSFRDQCGDGYISEATLGSALFVVFDFDARAQSRSKRRQNAGAFEASLLKVFNLGGSGGSTREFESLMSELRVKVSGHQIGGTPGLAASMNPKNVVDKFHQFAADDDPEHLAALDTKTTVYSVPSTMASHAHEEVFADIGGPQGPRAKMRRWADVSVQVQERCRAWQDFRKSAPDACRSAKTELAAAMELCYDMSFWEQCVNPDGFSLSSGKQLMSWLSENIKELVPASRSEPYEHHVHNGSRTVNDRTCLPSSRCFFDESKGSGLGAGKGFSIDESEYDNPKGRGRSHKVSANAGYCVNSHAFLDTYRKNKLGFALGDTTADWKFAVTVYGICPVTKDFKSAG